MPILFFFQDVVGLWARLADQGIAIAVLIVIGVFALLFVTKILPTWERVKTAESDATKALAKSLGEMAGSQNQLSTVVKDIAIDQKQSTEVVKILQRVTVNSTEQLTKDVQQLNTNIEDFKERFDRLETKINEH